MDEYLVAVASSDGAVVNQHFGHAERFLIYRVHDHRAEKVETREVNPACITRDHDENAVAKVLEALGDCRYLLVAKIGMFAEQQAESRGITPLELPMMIEDALQKTISFAEVQELLERDR